MGFNVTGSISVSDVRDGERGPAGPSTIERFRAAADAAAAGRPATDSGLDLNWTDNPDLVVGPAGTLIFRSTQFANVITAGVPYNTDIVGSGISGGTWVPARAEVNTITVDGGAMSSTLDSGAAESARFTISGSPGNAVAGTPGQFTIEFTGLPANVTYDASDSRGGGELRLFFDVIRTDLVGTAAASLDVENDSATSRLNDYAIDQGLADGATIDARDFVEFALNGTIGQYTAEFTGVVTRGIDSVTAVLTQTANDLVSFLWTGVTGVSTVTDEINWTGANAGITDIPVTVTFDTASIAEIFGAQTVATIPYVDGNGLQQTYTSPTIRFQSGDTTSALQAQRFVDAITPPANSFTIARDTDDVVVTGLHEGNVTGAYVFTTTQGTGSTIAFSTPVITEGMTDETPSTLTLRTFTSTGAQADTTIMFASGQDATQIASEIATDFTANTAMTGYTAASVGQVATLTADTMDNRTDTTITGFTAGTNGNFTASTFSLNVVDGVAFETEFTGTRSVVTFANGGLDVTRIIPPETDLSTELLTEIFNELDFGAINMYGIVISGDRFNLQSQSRALGADQTVSISFSFGDSSLASIIKENEQAGQNEFHDGVRNGWSFARLDSVRQ